MGRGVRGGESSRRLSEVLGLGCPERLSVDWLRFDIHGARFVHIEHRLGNRSRISGTIEFLKSLLIFFNTSTLNQMISEDLETVSFPLHHNESSFCKLCLY